MRYRKLRIAWSVLCGIVCLLLVVLWVRSYANTLDQCFFQAGKSFEIDSHAGYVWFGMIEIDQGIPFEIRTWKVTDEHTKKYANQPKFRFMEPTSSGWSICVFAAPHWFLMLSALVIATLPWFRWRFSLRTLLIATTLVAVVLGIIVWTTRAG